MPSQLELVTHEDLSTLFRNNLPDLGDRGLTGYIVMLMVRFVNPRRLEVVFDARPDSVKLDYFWQDSDRNMPEAYNRFREFGDAYLFLCGF